MQFAVEFAIKSIIIQIYVKIKLIEVKFTGLIILVCIALSIAELKPNVIDVATYRVFWACVSRRTVTEEDAIHN